MNEDACNYNSEATLDDESCVLPEFQFDCSGNCIVEIDCAGLCGGDNNIDNCGVCDNDSSNDCLSDCLGVPGGSAIRDCSGACEGNAYKDCGNQCCIDDFVFDTDLPCLKTDDCGICNAESFSDIYPRLDDCDESCTGLTNYYEVLFGNVVSFQRNCADIKVLQDIIDINISNGNFDSYSTLMDDFGNGNGII